jgi:hypothetical protein
MPKGPLERWFILSRVEKCIFCLPNTTTAGVGGQGLAVGHVRVRRLPRPPQQKQRKNRGGILSEQIFATYFVEVPFVPAQRIMNHPIPDENNDAYSERSTFAWVPYSALAGFLDEDLSKNRLVRYLVDPAFLPAHSETQWLWAAWLRSMRKAVVTNALPWKKQ